MLCRNNEAGTGCRPAPAQRRSAAGASQERHRSATGAPQERHMAHKHLQCVWSQKHKSVLEQAYTRVYAYMASISAGRYAVAIARASAGIITGTPAGTYAGHLKVQLQRWVIQEHHVMQKQQV